MDYLTNDFLDMALPAIAQEYGAKQALDIVISANHEIIGEAFPDVKPSGIYVQGDGALKILVNLHADLSLISTG